MRINGPDAISHEMNADCLLYSVKALPGAITAISSASSHPKQCALEMVTIIELVPEDHLLSKRAEMANFTNKVNHVHRLVWHGEHDIIINVLNTIGYES